MDLLELQRDPAAFRQALLIDTDAGPRPLAECMDDWQRQDFEALDAGWRKAAGQKAKDARLRAWLERPRGHAKSSDAMVMASWALFASRKQLAGVVCAVDRDQAALDRNHVARLVALNPWLGAVLDVQQWRIVNKRTGSALDIISSDAPSSYGLLIDFAICDEVTIWPKRDLFDSILSASAKRSSCLLLCIGNAGFQDSWCWSLRESVRTDPAWHFSRLEGCVASWITPANLDEQRRLLPQVAYNRLWLNLWSTGGGDALTEADIKAAFIDGLEPFIGGEDEHADLLFVAGVDLGLTRDSSALVILGVPEGGGAGRIRLCRHDVWKPMPGKKVNLSVVEKRILEFDRLWGLEQVAFDPWQMEHLAQRLEADSGRRRRNQRRRFGSAPWMREIPPTGANLREQATLTIECFQDRRLALYPCEQLKRDLLKLRVEEKSYGIRLVSPRDGEGHGDLFSAFANALVIAHELAGKRPVRAGVVGLDDDDDDESPMDRAMRRVEERDERQARREQRHLAAYRHVDEHQEGMLRALQQQLGKSPRHRGIRLPRWRGGW